MTCQHPEDHRQFVMPDGSCRICTIVDAAPPLSEEQRSRLRLLIRLTEEAK